MDKENPVRIILLTSWYLCTTYSRKQLIRCQSQGGTLCIAGTLQT